MTARANGELSGAEAGHVAVIDIGSNSIRLVVYDKLSRAPLPRFNEKSLCGLGRNLSETGEIASEAFDCAHNAVHRFFSIARAMGSERVDLIATEAVRRATNGADLVEAMQSITDRPVRILAGEEEAYFSARGVAAGFFEPRGLVGDLGGGSLDVAELNDKTIGDIRVSLPIGSLRSTALLEGKEEHPKRAVDEIIADKLGAYLPPPNFYLVGGSWRAIGAAHMAAQDAPLKFIHGYSVEGRELRRFAKSLWRMDQNEISTMPGLSNRRSPQIRGAALVLDRALKRIQPERVVFSALGLREGWLFEQLSDEQRAIDPLIDAARSFGRPNARVPEFDDALIRWTDKLFRNEGQADRRLRWAACMLSDIAWADHRDVQARMCFDRLLRFPFITVDHADRAFLATAVHARYSGDADAPELETAKRLLSPPRIRRAQVLGRAMLVGHRLSGSVPEILDRARLRLDSNGVAIELDGTLDVPDSDAVRTRLRQLARAIGVKGAQVETRTR